MKKLFSLLLLFLPLFLFIIPVLAVSFPKPTGFVTDTAGLYTPDFKSKLESNLSNFAKQTKTEIAIVTITSLEGMDVETYASKLFEEWKIGKKGQDNGLLLLISKDERKIRIEVGYGLEQYVNDGRAGDISRNMMTPEFKKENYEGGTLAAVTQLEKYISDKDIAPKESMRDRSSGSFDIIFIMIIIFIYLIGTYFASFLGRTKEIWPGGAVGAVLGAVAGFLALSVIGLIIGAVILGGFGLILDYILTKNFQNRKDKHLPTGFWNTWGGFSGGGGRSLGGGFGGFGGGRSGGGGSSGGW